MLLQCKRGFWSWSWSKLLKICFAKRNLEQFVHHRGCLGNGIPREACVYVVECGGRSQSYKLNHGTYKQIIVANLPTFYSRPILHYIYTEGFSWGNSCSCLWTPRHPFLHALLTACTTVSPSPPTDNGGKESRRWQQIKPDSAAVAGFTHLNMYTRKKEHNVLLYVSNTGHHK